MGSFKKRPNTRRNNSRQAAVSFLTNITLGNEHEPKKVHYSEDDSQSFTRYGTLSVGPSFVKGYALESSDSNSTLEETVPITLKVDTRNIASARRLRRASTSDNFYHHHRRLSSSDSNASFSGVVQHKLTREDSERPIASEKIKKRSEHILDSNAKNNDNNSSETPVSMSFMSVFRYYKGMIRQPKRKSNVHSHNHHPYSSYFYQHLSNMNTKHRKAISYGHFLSQASGEDDSDDSASNTSELMVVSPQLHELTYDPYYLSSDMYNIPEESSSQVDGVEAAFTKPTTTLSKRESNMQFSKSHPDVQISLSKINSIKQHLLNIGRAVDLEISSVAHAYVYFEKLIQKQIVMKQNRKLLSACCLFLATKVNEPKGLKFNTLLEAIQAELYVNSKDVRDHEFAVFADLEFNLYVPQCEFMPHFDSIVQDLRLECIEDYLGSTQFYVFTPE